MTIEEAIKKLKSFCHNCNKYPQCVNIDKECFVALDMAIRALKNEQSEQNVGMCQQNVGEMSEKQTDEDLQKEIDFWHTKCAEYEQTIAKMAVELNDIKAILGSAEKTDGDLISREEMLDYIQNFIDTVKTYHPYAKCKNIPVNEVIDRIKRVPSADKTAEWVAYTEESGWLYQCSNCCWSYEEETKYCPNCGSKMKGVD